MNKKTQDLVSSISLLCFAGLFYWGASMFPSRANTLSILTTGFYPKLLAIALASLSILLLISAVRRKTDPDEKVAPLWNGRHSVILFCSVLVALVLFPIVMEYIGFGVTTFVFISTLVFLLSDPGHRTPLVTLGISLAITIVIYLIFKKFLGIPFPSGILI